MEIQRVSIYSIDENRYRNKYILATINSDFTLKYLIRISCDLEHKDILEKLKKEMDEIIGEERYEINCLGGGSFFKRSNSIYVYGESRFFGKAPQDTVIKILKDNFFNFEIKNWNPEYPPY